MMMFMPRPVPRFFRSVVAALALLGFVPCIYAASQLDQLPVVVVPNPTTWQEITHAAFYIEDETGRMAAAEALRQLGTQPINSGSALRQTIHAPRVYWLAFQVLNHDGKDRSLVVRLGNKNGAQLYRVENGATQFVSTNVNPNPSANAPMALRFELKANETVLYLARLDYQFAEDQAFAIAVNSSENALSFFSSGNNKAGLKERLPVAVISDFEGVENLTRLIHYIEDLSNQMTLADALARLDQKEINLNDSFVKHLRVGHSYWLTFAVWNHSEKERDAVVKIGHKNDAQFYRVTNGIPQLMGHEWPAKSFSSAASAWHVNLQADERAHFLARLNYQQEEARPFALTLEPFEKILNQEATIIHAKSVVLGMLLILAIYHLVLGFSFKDRVYFYYFLFLCSCCFLLLATFGYGLQYLWPHVPHWKEDYLLYALVLPVIAWVFFAKYYLDTPHLAPVLNFVFNIAALVSLLPILLAWSGVSSMNIEFAAVCGLMLFVAVSCAACMLVQRAPHVLYFVVANVPLIAVGLVLILQHYEVCPSNQYTAYVVQGSVALQAALMSLGLGKRLILLRREKEAALSSDLDHQKGAIAYHEQLTKAYARFVPMEFFSLLDKKSILDVHLGDAMQHYMSVLFADIRSFTSLCESLSPSDSFRVLNEYLKYMGPIIRKSNGFIDKYIGDAIMALFPVSADHSVTAAMAMTRGLKELNELRRLRREPKLSIGIGIHTGKLVLGTLGEEERMEGTVISDVVNVAARLEELTKRYGVSIIISDVTLQDLRGALSAYRFLGEVKLKGRNQVTKFFEIFQADEETDRTLKNQTKAQFEEAVALYLQGDHYEAGEVFKQIISLNPTDKPANYYYAACATGSPA
ncbi:MAG: adenylate/guanylate cyclase domain-containing protein [bacterium]